MSLFIATATMFFLPIIGVVLEPGILIEKFEFYLLFVLLPLGLGLALWIYARRHERRLQESVGER